MVASGSCLLLCLNGLLWQGSAVIDPKVREFYMYRASQDVTQNEYIQENTDLADLVGALKYVHTEIIAEHTQTSTRTKRKYNIDKIARFRVLVRNPGTVIDMNQPPMVYTDFGPFVTFDYGQATNNVDKLLNLGNYVGAQRQVSSSWEYNDPYYWYSLPGFCPNLPYTCTDGWEGGCVHKVPIHTALCTPAAPCPAKGTRAAPSQTCKVFESSKKVPQGGLCGNHGGMAAKVQLKEPNGGPGCQYSYNPAELKQISLDELVGINDTANGRVEECAGGPCKNWQDFRSSCTNSKYKQVFEGDAATAKLVDSTYCVEYDIHPACAASCSAADCLAVPEESREVGLPFWKGRCDARANQIRAESIAKAFGIAGATDAHRVLELPTADYKDSQCDRFNNGGTHDCHANFASGGPFCSREWGGVCTVCRIEGTNEEFPNLDMPICPLNVMTIPDYKVRAENECMSGTCCKSTRPSGKCCLYFDSCTVVLPLDLHTSDATEGIKKPMKLADVGVNLDILSIDEDNMILVAATGDTTLVYTFMKSIVATWGQIASINITQAQDQQLKDLAYWSWGITPVLLDESLEKVKEGLSAIGLGPTTTTTTTTTPTQKVQDGGNGWIKWVIIIAIVIVLGGAAAWYFTQKQGGGAREQPLTGGVSNELPRM